MKLFAIALGLFLVSPALAQAQSVKYSERLDVDGRSMSELSLVARENALQHAMQKLPALVLGRERLEGGEYSIEIENWRLAGLEHEFVSSTFYYAEDVAEFHSVIHYDKQAVIDALVQVSESQQLTRDAESMYDLTRNVEGQALSAHFLARAEKQGDLSRFELDKLSNDERILRIRIAQEAVVAEVMKDVHVHFIIPALQALRDSTLEFNEDFEVHHRTGRKYVGGNRFDQFSYTPELPPVSGAEPNEEGIITWHAELDAILAPYQERFPYITKTVILERMKICPVRGRLLDKRGQELRVSRNILGEGILAKHQGFAFIRPDYNIDTMRRAKSTITIGTHRTGQTDVMGAAMAAMRSGITLGVCVI